MNVPIQHIHFESDSRGLKYEKLSFVLLRIYKIISKVLKIIQFMKSACNILKRSVLFSYKCFY